MRIRASLILAALLVAVVSGCSRRSPPAITIPQTISFTGFTNGYVGAIAPTFATMTTENAADIKQWLADGTNSAMFTITNQQSCDIVLRPIGYIFSGVGANPATEETPILNAPNLSGIRLKPGEVSTIQIALFRRQTPWRMHIIYSRADYHIGFIRKLDSLMFHTKIRANIHSMESDSINQ